MEAFIISDKDELGLLKSNLLYWIYTLFIYGRTTILHQDMIFIATWYAPWKKSLRGLLVWGKL